MTQRSATNRRRSFLSSLAGALCAIAGVSVSAITQNEQAALSSKGAPGFPAQAGGSMKNVFAPSGTLRASINLGNPVLASLDPTTGEPVGISVYLANELARRLGVRLQVFAVESAGASVDSVNQDMADTGFLPSTRNVA